MTGKDWRKEPYLKFNVEYGWSTDEVEVELHTNGFAIVTKKTTAMLPEEEAKKYIEKVRQMDLSQIQKKVGLERARDATHVDLKLGLKGEEEEKKLYWDQGLEPLTEELDELIDEIIEKTRPKEEKK
jgi:hypothetical protein